MSSWKQFSNYRHGVAVQISSEVFGEWVVRVSPHAEVRAKQRGFRPADVNLILSHGTATEDGYVLTAKDARRTIEALKKQITAVERLAGAAVVTDGDDVITMYHPRPGRARHMLRTAGRRCRGE